MSLRVLFCILYVVGFSFYARRNWFASLCATIVLMAFLEHPDMPHAIAGIQGLNPWNLLMFCVILAWWGERRKEGRKWDVPNYVVFLLSCYFFVILVGFLRLAVDYKALEIMNESEFTRETVHYNLAYITSDQFIDCIKWTIPGILLYDGCRTRKRATAAIFIILLLYFLIAVQVIKYMPLSNLGASGAELSRRAAKVLRNNMGIFRIELSMMLSGASWAVLTTLMLVQKRKHRLCLLGAAAAISLAQALTGGRAGYVTWGLIGLILCLIRWRSFIPWFALVIVAVCFLMPGVRQRMLQGFGGTEGNIVVHEDEDAITAGRTRAWSFVIPKIWESPFLGYGRQAMIRTGIYQKILYDTNDESESYPHPHNAYLELLLDGGFLSFFLVIPFYIVMVVQSVRLLLDRSDPLFAAAGGVACSLILALLIAAMGAESFYPKESSLGMFAAIGLMMRVYTERRRAYLTGGHLFGENDGDADLQIVDDLENVPVVVGNGICEFRN